MKLKTNKYHYILLLAICFMLIWLVAAFVSSYYDNAVQGTHEKGMYNMLQYITKLCFLISSISFVGFVILLIVPKVKNNEIK